MRRTFPNSRGQLRASTLVQAVFPGAACVPTAVLSTKLQAPTSRALRQALRKNAAAANCRLALTPNLRQGLWQEFPMVHPGEC
jgi:hypothetical protein